MVRQSPSKQTTQSTTAPIRRNKPNKPSKANKENSDIKTKQTRDKSICEKTKATKDARTEYRHSLFVHEYIKDLNGARAYRAVYGEDVSSADVCAAQLLKHPRVVEMLSLAKEERRNKIKIDANYVLMRLKEIDEMDALDILEDDGSVKPIRDWPKIWRQFISGFEISEILNGKGDDRVVAGIIKKIKWPDKTKNLELIGKHVNVGAFRELVGHSAPDGGPIEMKITAIDPIQASKDYQTLIQGM